MEYEQLLFDVTERVATITFNRPDQLNAWTPTLERELRDAIERASEREEVRAIVLTGAGRAFCAGADMKAAAGGRPVAPDPALASPDDRAQRYSYLLAVPKPLIAAINGAVVGVGACLTLYCDLRFMARGAKLAFPYSRRGLVAEHGSAWMLPRLVGPMHAADLLLTGRTVLAEEAASMGLVTVLEADGFAETARQRAADVANLCSPRSLRIIKQQLWSASSSTLAAATTLANQELASCFDTADFREGVSHFLEKRPPQFTGQ